MIGADGPVQTEVYFRTGPSFPIEGPLFGHILETGWMIEGGGRSLFFNTANDAAWTVDVSASNTSNHGQHSDIKIPLNILVPDQNGMATRVQFGGPNAQVPGVTLRELNRTFVSLGFGREWYMTGPANCCHTRWRVGFDAGGRYGTAEAEFQEIRHRQGVIAGAYLAVHTDIEIPHDFCTFFFGFRTEWGFTWSDSLLQENPGNMQEINFLITAGIRF
jgi:hypothetical protein